MLYFFYFFIIYFVGSFPYPNFYYRAKIFYNKPWVIEVPETSVQGIIVFSITMKKILDTQKCILLTCKKHCDIILTGKNCIMFIHIINNLHDRRFII